MTAERRDRVWELFDRAADLPPGERCAFLDRACGGDHELRAEVESLLAHDIGSTLEGEDGRLASPLVRRRSETLPRPAAPRSVEAPSLPAMVGHYRVSRLLGEGGMGVVYEAEQDNPRRRVALKVIRPGLVSPAMLRRFTQEAQILGRLHHPGIAQIYEAGFAQDGQPFFAMEFVHGEPLDEYARLRSLTLPVRLELLARVCDAVRHAHEQGVIHRDLKPANILVDGDGQPRVLDFGVARATDADLLTGTGHTRTGQLVGTLSYMSPEQVGADTAELDPRSDVYTLGVILYELLAGRLPYPLERLALPELARVIRDQEPTRLGSIDTRYRGDVETIAAKALEKEPARRYPSAAELAADIRRHLRHEPIRARPTSALYQLRKFARRHKALVATTAAFLGLLLGGGAVTAWQAVRLARTERDQAVQQAQRSQDVQDALAQAASLREQARSAAGDRGQWAQARELARRAEALSEGGPVAPGLAERVADLLSELDEEQADRRMVARVEQTRLLQTEVNVAENRYAVERALPEYRRAFADFGLRPAETTPAEAAALLRSRPVAVRGPAVGALDDWLSLARRQKAPEADWLVQVLAAADPDDWRQRLRAARGRGARPALEELARGVDFAAQPPQALLLLYHALDARGARESAVRLLRRAQEAYPGDFWIYHNLGMALATSRPAQTDEAIRFLTAAVALRPDSPGAWQNLAVNLLNKGRFDEGVAACRKAIKLKRDYVSPHLLLGTAFERNGRLDEAIAAYRDAVGLRPGNAVAHYNLGGALRTKGDLAGAAVALRAALAIDPNYGMAHHNLGNTLLDQGNLSGAADCYQRVLQIDPRHAESYCGLGVVLERQGDPAGAADRFRQAIQINPRPMEFHRNLGIVLERQGDLPGAAAAFRRVVQINPNLGSAHNSLGHILRRLGDLPGAVAAFRRLIQINPEQAEAYCYLGDVLLRQGDLRAAVEAARRGHALGSKRKDRGFPSARWVKRCERIAELDGRLPAILKGEDKSVGAAERIELGELCRYKGLTAASTRFYTEAFDADANLAAYRYQAACSAALAGSGEGEDAATVPDKARASLRKQALAWLRTNLAVWFRRLEDGAPPGRAGVQSELHVWRSEPALAGVRDAGRLAALPAVERAAWEQLWADVVDLIAKVREAKSSAGEPGRDTLAPARPASFSPLRQVGLRPRPVQVGSAEQPARSTQGPRDDGGQLVGDLRRAGPAGRRRSGG